ncbi:MAG: hypothetical protein PVF17_06595 [Ignavibacteria bacterium]|jgi:hypothetical protein
MYKSLVILFALIVISCSSTTYIQESFAAEDYDFIALHNSNIEFAWTEKILLNEFVKTFNDEYSDTNKLTNKLFALFSNEFKHQIPGIKLSQLEINVPPILQHGISLSNQNQTIAERFFASLESDYIIVINSIEIDGADENSQYYNPATSTISGSSSEECVVSLDIEIWDIKNQKRILRFFGLGTDTVVLFSYLSSLNNAMKEAVAYSVKFIKGKVK